MRISPAFLSLSAVSLLLKQAAAQDDNLECPTGTKRLILNLQTDQIWSVMDLCNNDFVLETGADPNQNDVCLTINRNYRFDLRTFDQDVVSTYTLIWDGNTLADNKQNDRNHDQIFFGDNSCAGSVNPSSLPVPSVVVPPPPPPPPPVTAGGGGDPHFKTWNGHRFDFHGACDMILLSAPRFFKNLGGLDIHIRTQQRYEYSFIQSVALRIGDEGFLQVSGWGDVVLNGIGGVTFPTTLGGVAMIQQVNSGSKKKHVLEITSLLDEQAPKIRITTLKDMVSVAVEVGDINSHYLKDSVGLLGDSITGDMLARDGRTALNDDPNAFGQEWQVRDTEPKLFQSTDGPQFPQKCIMPKDVATSTTSRRRRLGERIVSMEAAKAACAKFHQDDSDDDKMNACVFDVLATNDLEMAEAAGAF